MPVLVGVRSLILSVHITKCTDCPFYDRHGPTLIPSPERTREILRDYNYEDRHKAHLELEPTGCIGPWCYYGDHVILNHAPDMGIPEWCGLFIHQYANKMPLDYSGINKIRMIKAKGEK